MRRWLRCLGKKENDGLTKWQKKPREKENRCEAEAGITQQIPSRQVTQNNRKLKAGSVAQQAGKGMTVGAVFLKSA